MTKQEYNGWTNYETWLVKLWMDNEEGSQHQWQEAAEQNVKRHSSPSILADMLKQEHEDALPELTGWARDLINAAMSEVNWLEIAESLIADAKEALAA